MGLINCPECENMVSDRAVACPKCGYPISQEIENTQQQEKKVYTPKKSKDIEETIFVAKKDETAFVKSMGLMVVALIFVLIFSMSLGGFMTSFMLAMFIPFLIVITLVVVIKYTGEKELYFTNKRVVGNSGVLFTQTLNAPLDRVDNVLVRRIPMMTSSIEITTMSGKYIYNYVANAEEFRDKLLEQIEQIQK